MRRPALVPELYVSDLGASLEFYVALLGFRIEYERPEEKFAALSLGDAHLMLEEAPSLARATPEEFRQGQWRTADLERPFGRGLNLEIEVGDIDAMDSRIAARGQPLLRGLHEKSYRIGAEHFVVRRLLVADPDGYLIRLSQRDRVVALGE
jgi:catechol 2,3-dioxygenase-like lactoylglutathione lyase family enzyme